jgi:hypothetical protein
MSKMIVRCGHLALSIRRSLSFRARSLVADADFIRFQLHDVLSVTDTVCYQSAKYGHVTNDIIDASLESAIKLAENDFLPHSHKNDENEPKWTPQSGVKIIPEVSEALKKFKEAGFFGRVPS